MELDLLKYQKELVITNGPNHKLIFDPVRRKHVKVTPEEIVRQLLLVWLIREGQYPISLLKIEHPISFGGQIRRADVVVYGREGKPVMLIECKSANEQLNQSVLQQTLVYYLALPVPYVLISNGVINLCYCIDKKEKVVNQLETIPTYAQLIEDQSR